jgi:hypothetical protein
MGEIRQFENLDDPKKKFRVLIDKNFKVFLGRKNTLLRMIEKRNDLLKPILLEEVKLKKEIEKFQKELNEINEKILEISQDQRWEPSIIIVKCKVKGNPYYKGKIRFRKDKGREKVKMIPKKIELKIWKKVQDDNPNDTDEKLEGVFKGRLRNWILDWWRKEGILEKK